LSSALPGVPILTTAEYRVYYDLRISVKPLNTKTQRTP
jgi:hypothetical protein